MKKTDEIMLSNPLLDISDPIYPKLFEKAKKVEVWTGDTYAPLDIKSQRILTNYSYFIYELLELNQTRLIDYRTVKKFAKTNKGMLDYVFDKNPVISKLNSWLKEDVEIVEMGMYIPTDNYNKNTHH